MEELGVADLIAMVRALQSQMNSMREMYEARIAELEAEKRRVEDPGGGSGSATADQLAELLESTVD